MSISFSKGSMASMLILASSGASIASSIAILSTTTTASIVGLSIITGLGAMFSLSAGLAYLQSKPEDSTEQYLKNTLITTKVVTLSGITLISQVLFQALLDGLARVISDKIHQSFSSQQNNKQTTQRA